MSSQCTFAAMKANGAVLGSCSHSVERSVTVLLSIKEATSAEQCPSVGTRFRKDLSKLGKCGRGPSGWWRAGACDTGGVAQGTGLVLAWRREGYFLRCLQ